MSTGSGSSPITRLQGEKQAGLKAGGDSRSTQAYRLGRAGNQITPGKPQRWEHREGDAMDLPATGIPQLPEIELPADQIVKSLPEPEFTGLPESGFSGLPPEPVYIKDMSGAEENWLPDSDIVWLPETGRFQMPTDGLEDYAYPDGVAKKRSRPGKRVAYPVGSAQSQQQGDNQAAVNLYQQAAQLAPQSKLRASAQYDAATALLAQQSWQQAIVLLEHYRVDYPNDPLQTEVTRKLAYAHEQIGHDQQAAAEYWQLGQDQKLNPDLQREALLRVGDLYLQAGKIDKAINARKIYLERFPEPATVTIGVMQQLADIEVADSGKRQHWLEAIIVADRAGGTEGTRVIAAAAALQLANRQLAEFRRIQLVNPVKKSLGRKLQAMKQALQAFESAIDYGVGSVVTAATYQIATMYDELGDALLASERPGSLTDEELAEYDVSLAEQAAPFEQQAIDVYTTNAQRSSSEPGDPWIAKSVQRLAELQSGQ